MLIALTGATGIVGSFISRAATAAGHVVDPLPGYRLGDVPDLSGHDALIHAAFAHNSGRYRGGEGDDPAAFRTANLDGTLRLFDTARRAKTGRIIFLSSRAVHDGHPPGTDLADDLPAAPTTLYGEVKALAEQALADLPATSLRATGIYGPGPANKWRGLFADFRAGRPITPRVATEVHGDDLAAAVLLLLAHPKPPLTANVSDLVLERRDLLERVALLTDSKSPLPERADASALSVPVCTALHRIGWQPGGLEMLIRELPQLLDRTV